MATTNGVCSNHKAIAVVNLTGAFNIYQGYVALVTCHCCRRTGSDFHEFEMNLGRSEKFLFTLKYYHKYFKFGQ